MMQNRTWRRWLRLPRDPVNDVDDELAFHFEERVRDYVARGMDPESARRAARARMGDIERARIEGAAVLSAERRTEERKMRLNVSWLDVKLGLRMLGKYPGLSLVSVIGMAVAIAIGAGYYAGFGMFLQSDLPLDEGDRVVGLIYRDVSRPGDDAAVSAHDYGAWRDALGSVRDLGAFRSQGRNLITAEGRVELVEVASMTASAFRVVRVSPALGRPLLEEDERPGAPPVLVIAHEEWQRVFEGEPDVLGKTVRLGETFHTIVGVMPAGFRFPIAHRYWAPLQLDLANARPGDAASLLVFGRLEDGVTMAGARAELTTVGERMAGAFPETHEHLRPDVVPYAQAVMGVNSPQTELALRAARLAVSLLLVIVALNVAVVVYARTVTRTGEVMVRTALGATRRRVVTQLFVEALVLTGIASVLGLALAATALRLFSGWLANGANGDGATRYGMPFWMDFGLSFDTVVYALLLALLAAAIVGVLPALKATGKRLHAGLQQYSSRGAGMQLGRTWSALIVLQVAIAVAVLPAAVDFADQSIQIGTSEPAPAAHGLLTASLVLDREATAGGADSAAADRAFRARLKDRAAELDRRLEAQPLVAGVAFAGRFPGEEFTTSMEVERADAPSADTTKVGPLRVGVRPNVVDLDFFRVFDVPILAGRGFVPADTREGATAVIVTTAFAAQVAGGGRVIGRRIRYAETGDDAVPGPWLEIVGVVPDFASGFTTSSTLAATQGRLFRAAVAGETNPSMLVVRIAGGAPAPFAQSLRTIAASVDPALKLEQVESVVAAFEHEQQAIGSVGLMIIAVALSVLLLSAAGIYALMSFAVAKRRREIGIRSALGAHPRHVLLGIFARAGSQLGAGVLVGLTVAVAYAWMNDELDARGLLMLAIVSAIMLTVGVLAALGPARRGLTIQPTEALREE